jgi:hypothetical protein
MAIAFLRVVCGECGSETNKVEYDPAGREAKVAQVASALGISTDAAAEYVDQHSADPTVAAQGLAASLVDDDISPCPQGHTGQLRISA